MFWKAASVACCTYKAEEAAHLKDLNQSLLFPNSLFSSLTSRLQVKRSPSALTQVLSGPEAWRLEHPGEIDLRNMSAHAKGLLTGLFSQGNNQSRREMKSRRWVKFSLSFSLCGSGLSQGGTRWIRDNGPVWTCFSPVDRHLQLPGAVMPQRGHSLSTRLISLYLFITLEISLSIIRFLFPPPPSLLFWKTQTRPASSTGDHLEVPVKGIVNVMPILCGNVKNNTIISIITIIVFKQVSLLLSCIVWTKQVVQPQTKLKP